MVRLILPVKDVRYGKSRLHIPGVDRSELTVAMLRDALDVAVAADVGPVVVVSPDRRVGDIAKAAGALYQYLDAGLNESIRATVDDRVCAALLPDVPAVRPEDLRQVLNGHVRGFVPDRSGTGTTLAFGPSLRPVFGPGSAARFAASGLPRVDAPDTLRADVDTAADLAHALALGVGRHTADLLARQGVDPLRTDPMTF